jgi:hypothetical protein
MGSIISQMGGFLLPRKSRVVAAFALIILGVQTLLSLFRRNQRLTQQAGKSLCIPLVGKKPFQPGPHRIDW